MGGVFGADQKHTGLLICVQTNITAFSLVQIGEKAVFCMEILSDFIFIVCVFFMPLVLGYAEYVDVPSAVTALDTRRIKYASRVETTSSASKLASHRALFHSSRRPKTQQ